MRLCKYESTKCTRTHTTFMWGGLKEQEEEPATGLAPRTILDQKTDTLRCTVRGGSPPRIAGVCGWKADSINSISLNFPQIFSTSLTWHFTAVVVMRSTFGVRPSLVVGTGGGFLKQVFSHRRCRW